MPILVVLQMTKDCLGRDYLSFTRPRPPPDWPNCLHPLDALYGENGATGFDKESEFQTKLLTGRKYAYCSRRRATEMRYFSASQFMRRAT